MVNYNEYSLDVDMYGTLISIAGDIVKINEDRSVCTVVSDDGIDLDVIIHPAVTEAYDKNDFELEIDDSVDMLGTCVREDGILKMLALRCVVYPKAPKYLS